MASKPTIFVDMDGVLCDFDRHFMEIFGLGHPAVVDDDILWDHILNKYPKGKGYSEFFLDLPWLPGAEDFMIDLLGVCNPVILTACTKHAYTQTAIWKRRWMAHNVNPKVKVMPVLGGKNKVLFRNNANDLIIDDMFHVIEHWGSSNAFMINHEKNDHDFKQKEKASKHGFAYGLYDEALVMIEERLWEKAKPLFDKKGKSVLV